MKGAQKALTLAGVLAPLWLFYAALYALLEQTLFNQATHAFLVFGKLIFPPLVLGGASYLVYARARSASLPRLWLPLREIRWPVVVLATLCGILLGLLPHMVSLVLHLPKHTPPMLYYGAWSVYDPLFWICNVILLGSNYAEEIFFRGLLYPYLRGRTGIALANILTVVIFTVAHFPPWPDIAAVLIGLALFMTFFVQMYDTLFYAFIAHSAVNLASFLFSSSELRPIFFSSQAGTVLFYVVLALVAGGFFLIYRPDKRFTRI